MSPQPHVATMNGEEAAADSAFRLSRVGRHTLVYSGGILLSKAAAFVMLPVYTRYLSPADYGTLELIQMTLDVVAILAGWTFVTGVFRFFAGARSRIEQQAVLATALLLLSASFTVLGFATFAASGAFSTLVFQSPAQAGLIQIAALSLVCDGLLLVPLAYIRIRERSRVFVGLQIVKLAMQLSLNVVFLVFLGMGARGCLISTLIANLALVAFALPYMLREVSLRPSRQAAQDLLRFGIPLIGGHLAIFIVTYGDRYFLQSAAGTAAVGLYALAYQFGFLLTTVVYAPFAMVWEPARFEIAKRPDRDDLYARTFVYLNLVLLTVAVSISLFVADFLQLIASPAFYSAGDLVPIILAAYVLQAWTNFHNIGIMVRDRTEFTTLANWVAAVVALVGYALLIPRWFGLGAAVATFAAFAVREWIVYVVSQRLWPVAYDWPRVLPGVIAAIVVSVAGVAAGQASGGVSPVLRLMLFAAYLAALWHLVLSPEDRSALRECARTPRVAVAWLRG